MEGSMQSIAKGLVLGVALLGLAARPATAQWDDGLAIRLVAADSITVPGVLMVFEHGVPVRATFAEYGDDRRPVTELTGTFMEFQPDAFTMEVRTGDAMQIRQVAIDDLLRLEIGIERSLTKRATLVGTLGGVALGLLAAGLGDAGGADVGDAGYAGGAALFGLAGAGVGALIGSRQTTMEWRKVPIYGEAYCQ